MTSSAGSGELAGGEVTLSGPVTARLTGVGLEQTTHGLLTQGAPDVRRNGAEIDVCCGGAVICSRFALHHQGECKVGASRDGAGTCCKPCATG